jgi:predicted TIM-barrel fold metal-dependent hydrolase
LFNYSTAELLNCAIAEKERGVMKRIDAHAHWAGDTPEAVALLKKLNVKILNICIGRVPGSKTSFKEYIVDNDAERYCTLTQKYPEHYAWCSGLDEPDFNNPKEYADKMIAVLEQDIKDGACSVKMLKNFGMAIKKPDGSYLMPDDPVMEPVISFIERSGVPFIMHVAEPLESFLPLDPEGALYNYLKKNQDFYFYNKEGAPTHKQIMDARDHIVERHPKLLVVGAHYGCMEYDVAEVAKRFDKYPNFMVDSSGMARVESISKQDPQKVRQFFEKYPDRIAFGTDRCTPMKGYLSEQLPQQQQEVFAAYKEHVENGYNYYATNETVKVRKKTAKGLGLSEKIIRKFAYENAAKWYGM